MQEWQNSQYYLLISSAITSQAHTRNLALRPSTGLICLLLTVIASFRYNNRKDPSVSGCKPTVQSDSS